MVKSNRKELKEEMQYTKPVPGLLDKKVGRRCHLLLNKRWHLLFPVLSDEPRTGCHTVKTKRYD
jgi:hypothetical protein